MNLCEASLHDVVNLFGIPSVEESRRYWLVRTNSGAYYRDFTQNGYIAIGWDYVTKEMVLGTPQEKLRAFIKVKEKQADSSNNSELLDLEEGKVGREGKITTILNKLIRFVKELHVNDVVLIPSSNSDYISIGIIKSEILEDSTYVKNYLRENPTTDIDLCPYIKRREVEWLKTVPKSQMDIYLSKALGSHHAICNIDDYSSYVNRTIYDIYERDNRIHAIFHTKNEQGISLYELRNFFDSMSDLIDDTCATSGLSLTSKNIDVKLNIHSPGVIEIMSYAAGAAIVISSVIFALAHYRHGGKIDASAEYNNGNFKLNISSESKGTLQYQLDKEKLERAKKVQQEANIAPPQIKASGLTLEAEKIVKE